MILYLMRHAEPESGEQMDPTRDLTATGVQQCAVMGDFMRRQAGTVDLIISSHFRRAEHTAQLMGEELECKQFQATPALDPNAISVRAWEEVRRIADGRTALVVTHHPLTNNLLEYLTGGKTNEVAFKHGFIVKIEADRIHWMVGPALVERDEAIQEAAMRTLDLMIERMMDEPPEFQEASERRDAALEKAYNRARLVIRKHFSDQEAAMAGARFALPGLQESLADAGGIEATLAAAVSGIGLSEELADLFDDAISEAMKVAGTHVAEDFSYFDADVAATFEGRYLAAHGFRKVTGGIDKTTIERVAKAVSRAYESGAKYKEIVSAIKAEFKDFSQYRANLIAQTELNRAYNAGVLDLGEQALATQKSWHTTSQNPCPICTDNESAGRIGLREAFPSGDQSPNAHPGCYCSLEVHA